MKPGNAALGSLEPWVDRQDTHSGLKRHEDKGERTREEEEERELGNDMFLGFESIQYEESQELE